MGSNPINLAVRFFLEIAGLVALGWWGWICGIAVVIHYVVSYDRVAWLVRQKRPELEGAG